MPGQVRPTPVKAWTHGALHRGGTSASRRPRLSPTARAPYRRQVPFPIVGRRPRRRRALALAGHRGEPEDLCTGLAEALVRRGIEQAIGGHDTQLAGAAEPVVLAVVFTSQVHEFRPLHAADNEAFGGLVAVAAMMVLGTTELTHDDLLFHFATAEVVAHGHGVGAFSRNLEVFVHRHHAAPD